VPVQSGEAKVVASVKEWAGFEQYLLTSSKKAEVVDLLEQLPMSSATATVDLVILVLIAGLRPHLHWTI